MTSAAAARRILVSGATSGIGAAVCRRLLAAGHGIVALGRDFSKLDCADDGRLVAEEVDLGDLDRLPSFVDDLVRRHDDLDGAVLAAGRGHLAHLEQFSYSQLRDLMDLNFTSQAFLARGLVSMLKRRRGGDLIFIGSEAALQGKRQGTVYCASKFAIRGFAQALRDETAKSGVKVSLIHPGMVRTPFFDELNIAPGPAVEHALDGDDVAVAVEFILGQPATAVVDEIRLSPLKQVVVFDRG